MEPLENVFLRVAGDGVAGVADCQDNFAPFSVCGNSKQTSWSIVPPRVLQKILHDK